MTKGNSDLPVGLWRRVREWSDTHFVKFVISAERGDKKNQLHAQAGGTTYAAVGDEAVKEMSKSLREALGVSSEDCIKIIFKKVDDDTDMDVVVGYCLKDMGKIHLMVFAKVGSNGFVLQCRKKIHGEI